MSTVEEIIEHYGTKGMRWGFRKGSRFNPIVVDSVGKIPSSRKSQKQHRDGPKSEQAAKVADIINNIKKNGIGAATNDDLKMLEQRIKLEVKYKEMFPRRKTLADHGFEMGKKILVPVFEKNAQAFLNDKAATALKGKEIVEVLELGKHSAGYGRHLKR